MDERLRCNWQIPGAKEGRQIEIVEQNLSAARVLGTLGSVEHLLRALTLSRPWSCLVLLFFFREWTHGVTALASRWPQDQGYLTLKI